MTLFLISGTYLWQFCFIWIHTVVMTFFLMPIPWVIEVFPFFFSFFRTFFLALLSKCSASWIENSWWRVYCSRNCLTITVGVNSLFTMFLIKKKKLLYSQYCLFSSILVYIYKVVCLFITPLSYQIVLIWYYSWQNMVRCWMSFSF